MVFADGTPSNADAAMILSVVTAVGVVVQQVLAGRQAGRKEDAEIAGRNDDRIAPFLKDELRQAKSERDEFRKELDRVRESDRECWEEHARKDTVLNLHRESIRQMADTLRAHGLMSDSAVHRALPPESKPGADAPPAAGPDLTDFEGHL